MKYRYTPSNVLLQIDGVHHPFPVYLNVLFGQEVISEMRRDVGEETYLSVRWASSAGRSDVSDKIIHAVMGY